jgi:hypothetical protein
MLLGSEAIGVVAYAEAVGANQYADVTTGPLQLLISSKDLQSPLFESPVETASYNITINVDTTQFFKLYSVETGPLVLEPTEYSNKSYFEGLHEGSVTISGTTSQSFGVTVTETGVLTIVGPPLGGVFAVIPEIATASLTLGTAAFHQHYTFLLQEFESNDGQLAINGTSGEIYVIAGAGGGGTDIPQIWIG